MEFVSHKMCDLLPEMSRGVGVARMQGPRCLRVKSLFNILKLIALLLASASSAQASVTEICDQAARRAAEETNVPLSVLWSITRTETGRSKGGKLHPWPWTVNMEGKGHWFNSEDEARAYVFKHFNRGARSFDVGCFQINYKWHGTAFRSIDQMFDPLENARYAAAFLLRLYQETGDWSLAAGAYHSRTPEYANRYRARFDRIRRGHEGDSGQTRVLAAQSTEAMDRPATRKRVNTYPLLTHSGTAQSFGSLVRLGQGQPKALFGSAAAIEGS